jgi:hypothetical protein
MKEQIFRIEDYSKIRETHEKIIEILNMSKLSYCNIVGLLETIKIEILTDEGEGA